MEIVFLILVFACFGIIMYRSSTTSKKAQINLEQGRQFIEKNSQDEEIQNTESGLQFKVLQRSENTQQPTRASHVTVHYEGRLINGNVFDSSYKRNEPLSFPLNQVIQGWQEGLQLMSEGDKYLLFIPPHLGYGNREIGSIPPGSTLIFEVELLSINH